MYHRNSGKIYDTDRPEEGRRWCQLLALLLYLRINYRGRRYKVTLPRSSETVRRQLALALLLFKLNPFPIKKMQNYHQVSHQACHFNNCLFSLLKIENSAKSKRLIARNYHKFESKISSSPIAFGGCHRILVRILGDQTLLSLHRSPVVSPFGPAGSIDAIYLHSIHCSRKTSNTRCHTSRPEIFH